MRHAIPDTWGAFVALHRQALADGVVPASLTEALALAIAVVKRCDGCIAFHARAAARAGATPDPESVRSSGQTIRSCPR